MSSDTKLSVGDVSVHYHRSQALYNISLNVSEGEIVGLIGPNGAGKTTLLNAISGLKEYEGSISFKGTETGETEPYDLVSLGLTHCTENRDLFPYLSVEENLEMGAFARGNDYLEENLEIVYDLFPRLDERRSQNAETMSGGEQQMLAIGRALMTEPDLLMIDEPTQGLAPVIIESIHDAFEELAARGQTVFLVEQNAVFAMEHAERLYLLENGEITRSGTASEFREDEYIRDAYIGIA
ncbi:branched-chain amino acid transport ATP-binding protein LivF [Halarchaeum acidiphilum MH1-52-1]|uniref:Branched-chain amino acid transport ATP-binding protein LivF n=1 Tax=Halarchaeum acidiphilum MH1-52-1 TaxID=1261545 RepID=U2YYG5_9EURY|nr:ABC transporter ATP-binding protein [Halarchaeum acidiphilum]GAD53822.1 branched-chain amino acid transport ATP-binding protein LivF [Halarchaeum acidiphilum MH1-52-1]